MKKLLQSGIIFTALSFVTGLGNFAVLSVINLRFSATEVGLANFATPFMVLLGLPSQIAVMALVHHIAHFRGANEAARLQGLLAGCRNALARLTVFGCIAAVILVQPLSSFFNMPRTTLTVVSLVAVLIGLWGAYATALCQGMAWFKRLALIGLAGVLMKLAFLFLVTRHYATAEMSVLAIAVGSLANFAVFFWWRDLFQPGERVSPWTRDFFHYVLIVGAGMTAANLLSQGDVLAAKRNLPDDLLGAYSNANRISLALHLAVSPLLTVLFTARSSERSARSIRGPFALLALYAGGLVSGALVLLFARGLFIRLLNISTPETSGIVPPLILTMIFVGLIQALGMWAMASNWMRVSLLYGAVGVTYWAILLRFGNTIEALLTLMPIVAGSGFVIMLVVWIITLRRVARS